MILNFHMFLQKFWKVESLRFIRKMNYKELPEYELSQEIFPIKEDMTISPTVFR